MPLSVIKNLLLQTHEFADPTHVNSVSGFVLFLDECRRSKQLGQYDRSDFEPQAFEGFDA